jgi:aminomuconate-semialdehyde/2-hydroxymuconate-6-semialdehyde dehydrogenase
MLTALNFIDGRFVEPVGGGWLDNIEPATGRVIGRVAASESRDIDAAVAAGHRAFTGWSRTPADERARVLERLASLIERDAEALARAESIDTGKPIALARRMDIPRAAANFRFFAGAILHTSTASHRTELPREGGAAASAPVGAGASAGAALNITLRQPLGVVGLISPWNLPLYLLSWKIAPAIATGNTCVAKPSELTPTTAAMLAALCVEAGVPPGVVNIMHGTGPGAGAPLVAHAGVPAISFTGGTTTGAAISAVAAPMFKKLSLELGGKNATLVFDDVDLDEVMPQIVRASMTNQGQVCLCGSRILVARRVYDAFLQRFTRAVDALRLGDPLDDATEFGSLVSAAHLGKVRSYIELGQREGGVIANAGPREAPRVPERCAGGFFQRPVVFTGLGGACRTVQEEIFGPVVSVHPFDDDAAAIEMANATRYGLSASLWTRDISRAMRVSEALRAGTVWVNCWLVRDLRVPFGGVKDSGVGREGGEEALRFFTETKNVCVRY